jgi:hypothetical protein
VDAPDARREPLTFSAPDVPGLCVGWRAWTVVETVAGPRLASPMRAPTIWPPDQALVAQCTIRGHAVPGSSCTCGLYAVHDPTGVVWAVPDRTVMGYVALWGRVVEGERGWRASHGFPLMLLCPRSMPAARRRRLAATYRVPVVPLPPGLDRLACLEDDRVRDLADAVRRNAGTPSPALAHRIDELVDAVTAAGLKDRPERRDRSLRRSHAAGLARLACRLLDAVFCLAALLSLLLTAAVAQPPAGRAPATTIVDVVSGRTVAVAWMSTVALLLLRKVVVAPSLRTLWQRYPRDRLPPPVRPALVAVRLGVVVLAFATSWLGLFVSRESIPVGHGSQGGALCLVLTLAAAGSLVPWLARHRAPVTAFRDPEAAGPAATYAVEVSTAEAWSATHGALSCAERGKIARRPAR